MKPNFPPYPSTTLQGGLELTAMNAVLARGTLRPYAAFARVPKAAVTKVEVSLARKESVLKPYLGSLPRFGSRLVITPSDSTAMLISA